MSTKTHKIVSAVINLGVVLGSFEGLIAILNLNEPGIYARTAVYVSLFFVLEIVLLYDLHFKVRGSLKRAQKRHQDVPQRFIRLCKVTGSALWDRLAHLRKWEFAKQWLNYLILPVLIFWGSIAIFYVNFGFGRIQQIVVALSSVALCLNYWYLKEVFARRKEVVDRDIFVMLSVVKIYATGLVYMASLALVRHYCLDKSFLILTVFCLTFLLVYQALFQHRLVNNKNIFIALAIAVLISFGSFLALVFWGYNYFTAGVVLAAAYNLLWGSFHYYLDQALSWPAFLEILIISLLIAGMIFGVTNFKARILDACQYQFQLF